MRRRRTTVIKLMILCCLVLGVASTVFYIHETTKLSFESVAYLQLLTHFAQQHEGRLPGSLEELVTSGHLRRAMLGEEEVFCQGPVSGDFIYEHVPLKRLDRFEVLWDATPEKLHASQGRLYRVDNPGQECLLFSLKRHGPLRPRADSVRKSYNLFLTMQKASGSAS